MGFRKGNYLVFPKRSHKYEKIVRGSRDPIDGMIETEWYDSDGMKHIGEYSCHTMLTWLKFGWIKNITGKEYKEETNGSK